MSEGSPGPSTPGSHSSWPSGLVRARARWRRRGTWRGAVVGVLGGGLLVGGAGLLIRGWELSFSGGSSFWTGSVPGIAGALTVVGATLVGARVGRVRVERNWPRLWDRVAGWPDTMSTVVALCDRGSLTPWERALLGSADDLPAVSTAQLRRALPLRGSTLVVPIVLTAALVGVTLALPPSTAAPRPIGVARSLVETVFEGDSQADDVVQAMEAWEQGTGAASSTLASRAREAAERLRDETASRVRARARVAMELERLEGTAPLAGWLRERTPGSDLDLTALAALGEAERNALRRAARNLDAAGDPEPASWLEKVAAGTSTRPPEIHGELRKWRAAEVLVELLRDPGAQAPATFTDDALFGRGEQDPGANRVPKPDAPTATDPATGEPVEIDGRVAAQGALLDEILRGVNVVAEPDWDRILARPRVTPEEVRVAEKYRALRAREGDQP